MSENNGSFFSGDWLGAFLIIAILFGGFGGGGIGFGNRAPAPDFATQSDVQSAVNNAINNQTVQNGLNNVLLSSANNNYETARLIDNQTMYMANQNNTNLLTAINGFNAVNQNVSNGLADVRQNQSNLNAQTNQNLLSQFADVRQNQSNLSAITNQNMLSGFADVRQNQANLNAQTNQNMLSGFADVKQGIASLGAQMNECCCSIKTMMLENRLQDTQLALQNAQNQAVNAEQTQYLLGQMGKWYPNSPATTTAGG